MIRTFITRALFCAAALLSFNAYAAVDANKASQAELEAVKGIGPGLAGKILTARNAGSFKDWGDLVDRVGGVGPGNAARFSQAGLTVGGAAYEHRAAGAQTGKPAKAEQTEKAEKSPQARKSARAESKAVDKATRMEQGQQPATKPRKAAKTEDMPA